MKATTSTNDKTSFAGGLLITGCVLYVFLIDYLNQRGYYANSLSIKSVFSFVYMSVIFSCWWLYKGINNRTIILLLAITYLLNQSIYYSMAWLYEYQDNIWNPYLKHMTSLATILPTVIILTYRAKLSLFVLSMLWRFRLLHDWSHNHLISLRTTKLELKLKWCFEAIFVTEFLKSLYYAINGIGLEVHMGMSISAELSKEELWEPQNAYCYVVSTFALLAILILLHNIKKDRFLPDEMRITLSPKAKANLIKSMQKK